ncbi:MAG: hypothetical protein IPK80_25975 [Nannocystis sp.]|nr:hypothetical protein [Nannocystis sp.]
MFEAKHRAALRRYGLELGEEIAAPTKLGNERGIWLFTAEWSPASHPPPPGSKEHDESTRRGVGPVAGVRLDLRSRDRPLSLERAVSRFGQHDRLRRYLHGRVGELAGWWVDPCARSRGLPAALLVVGVDFAADQGLASVLTLVPRHTRAIVSSLGFQVCPEFGEDGELPYPDDRYRSALMRLDLLDRRRPLPQSDDAKELHYA